MTRCFIPLAFAVAVLAVAPAAAQEADVGPKIMVTGEGEANVSPDMAVITFAVLREAETARAAMDENNAAMAAVIAALKEEGVEARDLQTGGLAINPQYVYPNERNEEERPRITGYQVTNTLTVRVRDIEKVGEVLDRSVSLGVNQGGDITFTNDDPAEALKEARTRAVEDAFAKARTLAEAASVSLGDVQEISEQMSAPPPQPMARAMRMEAAADSSVPIEAGENSYKVRVNVTFALEQD
ncbi:SIMPL domain-containing protein [Chelativorans salis]|uniref:SIMPL domain-containing protein n=1 Tax=Chelativorans salis TaxID=2978478 RepID=A0ABT2LK06_9HYPH|nr:SIMPL domain-containing protein [Chelativorans sp. EGI FJ00035]MCT7374930.1 SIMPL domain-containing protein [Chelativorans sp. EGI FJ00035]